MKYLALSILGLVISCSYLKTEKEYIYCTPEDKGSGRETSLYTEDIPCGRDVLEHSSGITLEIHSIMTNLEPTENSGEYPGYRVLRRVKGGQFVGEVKIEREDDPYWSQVRFVKLREGVYFSDLNSDGYDEFAIFPFSPGSAIYGTVRIYTLSPDKISFFGEGRFLFESGGHVLLGCSKCSKFNQEACHTCY